MYTMKITWEIKYEYYNRFIDEEKINLLYDEISKHPHTNWFNESFFEELSYIEENNIK